MFAGVSSARTAVRRKGSSSLAFCTRVLEANLAAKKHTARSDRIACRSACILNRVVVCRQVLERNSAVAVYEPLRMNVRPNCHTSRYSQLLATGRLPYQAITAME